MCESLLGKQKDLIHCMELELRKIHARAMALMMSNHTKCLGTTTTFVCCMAALSFPGVSTAPLNTRPLFSAHSMP